MTPSRLLPLVALLLAAPLAAQTFGSGARVIRDGDALEGALTSSDPVLNDGSHFDLYRYIGVPGETVVFTLRSSDFDAYFQAGPVANGQYAVEVSDDDSGGGTNAELTVTVGSSGEYAVLANSLAAGSTGRYTILAESLGGGTPVAGGPDVIRAGDRISRRLDSSDPVLEDGSHYDLYAFVGAPGDEITVTMRSTDFDAFLSGGPLDGDAIEVVDTDDDGAGGTDAQLIVTVGPSGTYVIRANSLQAGQMGAYTLEVEAFGRAPVAAGSVLEDGDSVQGALEAGDTQLSDGSFYDLYTFQGTPGEEIEVFMASADFDAFLLGGPAPSDAFAGSDRDDDGGGGTNAQLRVTADASGRYTVIANSYAAGAEGRYQISVRSLTPDAGALAGLATVSLGQTVSGRLDASDPVLDDGTHYEFYAVTGAPGEDVVITLSSSDFDPFVLLNRLVGGEFESVATDDDSGPGVSARIRTQFGRTGTYVVVANSYAAGATGAYTLAVERAAAVADETAAESSAPMLSTGTAVSGRLEAGDSVLDDDSFADLYLYRGTPGETVAVTLRSSAFNAYLAVGTEDGDDITVVGRDDDSAGGTDARVQFSVGAGGLYAVQVNSLSARETGPYTVVVERVGTVAEGPRGPSRPSPAGTGPSGDAAARFTGKWTLGGYVEPALYGEALAPVREFVSSGGFLERTADALNASYPLPRNVPVSFDECSDPSATPPRPWPYANAFYSRRADEGAVTFCYELISDLVGYFATKLPENEVLSAVSGAYDFVMLHEVGHALRHQLDLPITGLEEDVADQFATLVLLGQGDRGADAALAGVDYLGRDPLEGRDLTEEEEAYIDRILYADEHSLGPQRLFNVQCWIYGSNQIKYRHLVEDEFGNALEDETALTPARAGRCPGEYQQMVKSFGRLLALVYNE